MATRRLFLTALMRATVLACRIILTSLRSLARTLERHRMVYAALGERMGTDIHALSIKAMTPDEVNP